MTLTQTTAADENLPSPPTGPDDRDDDDDDDAPIRPVRRRVGPLTLLLCGMLVAAAAFAGGIFTEKGVVTPATTTPARTNAAGATGSAGSGNGAFGSTPGVTAGTVTLVDGSNFYVTDASGTIVKIATTPQSQISVASSGTIANLKPGDTVTTTGPVGADGTVTATSVRDTGAGAGRTGGAGASRGTAPAGG